MELGQKLQQLRKEKNLTQEELAAALYVSRTAVSKWESGRGWPSIDSLKALSAFFGVSVDALLSGDEVLELSQQEQKAREATLRRRVFGLCDVGAVLFLLLPLFGNRVEGTVRSVSLLQLTDPLRLGIFGALVALLAALGLWALLGKGWEKQGPFLSLGVQGAFLAACILGTSPYAAVLLLGMLVLKGSFFLKKR